MLTTQPVIHITATVLRPIMRGEIAWVRVEGRWGRERVDSEWGESGRGKRRGRRKRKGRRRRRRRRKGSRRAKAVPVLLQSAQIFERGAGIGYRLEASLLLHPLHNLLLLEWHWGHLS